MLTPAEIEPILEETGEKGYRATQVLEWIWKKRVTSWDEMKNVPEGLRARLAETGSLRPLKHSMTKGSEDTTRKYLFELEDRRYIETVLIPATEGLYGNRADRFTLCVSSQVGCAYACKFCASGLDGFARNLTAREIAAQVLQVEEISGQKINNIVFMGMGEPLANLTNLTAALEMIMKPWGLKIGARHLTVSTSGLAPQIKKLAEFPGQIRLAISLHAPDDETRDLIMPVNRKYNLETLFEALQYWTERKSQRITLEYILIDGVNATREHAERLVRRARPIRAKVNLIPYNTVEGLEWSRPPEPVCRAFQKVLVDAGVVTTLRLEKGHDIAAACGQLRLKKERGEIVSSGI